MQRIINIFPLSMTYQKHREGFSIILRAQNAACCTAYICHNGPSAGPGRPEVDNGDKNI